MQLSSDENIAALCRWCGSLTIRPTPVRCRACGGLQKPHLHVGWAPVRPPTRLVREAGVRMALVTYGTTILLAGHAVMITHPEVAVTPLRPVARLEELVLGGITAKATYGQEALRLARLQAEEEVRRCGAVDAEGGVPSHPPPNAATA